MNIRIARRIITGTRTLSRIDGIHRIRNGFSADDKFLLLSAGRPRYLLRLGEAARYDRCREEFEI